MNAGMRAGLRHHSAVIPRALEPKKEDDPGLHTDHIRDRVPLGQGQDQRREKNGITTNLVPGPGAGQRYHLHTLHSQSIVRDLSGTCKRYIYCYTLSAFMFILSEYWGFVFKIAQSICLQKQLENLIQAAVEITLEVCCRVKRYGIFPEMSRQTAMK